MWNLDFISKSDFKEHVRSTIKTYNNSLKAYDLDKFNSNIIDPIKLTFDSKIYKKSIENVIEDEIGRQRDKTNTNAIGYFHQNIFKYFKDCYVQKEGFDLIYKKNEITNIFVEMKNKHNTMNSSSSQKIYIKMQNNILLDENCMCYLVEIIAKKSQDTKWLVSLDKNQYSNSKIRRVSIDKFYEEVTGNKNAFSLVCNALPKIIDEIISENDSFAVEKDTVIEQLKSKNPDILKSLYLLAFNTYEGFNV